MHPLLCHILGLPLKSYGLMITIGFAAGIALAWYRARRAGMDPDEILNMSTLIIISAIVGSRILYILVNPSEYIASPIRIFYIHEGGLVFLGGLIGTIVTVTCYLRYYKMDYLGWADIMFPSVPLGQFFGRLGCFLNGCCYGRPMDGFPGMVFPSIGDGQHYLPTQLLESTASLLILAILLFVDRGRKIRGMVFASYITLYSTWRFIIEFFRGDDRGLPVMGMPISQFLSLLGIFIGLIFLGTLLKKHSGSKEGNH